MIIEQILLDINNDQKINSLGDAYRLFADKLQGWLVTGVRSLPNLIFAIAFLIVVFIVARIMRKISYKLFSHLHNKAIENLLATLVFFVIMLAGTFAALGILNLDKTVTSLLAGAGIIGLALSFAFQDIAQNFISGVSMALRKPFKVGDTIEVGGKRGVVQNLNLRTTELINSSGEQIFIPNKELHQNALINSSYGETVRVRIQFGVPYSEDIEKVQRVVTADLEKQSHIIDHSVKFFFLEFQDDLIRCEARFRIRRGENDALAKSNAIKVIKNAFDENQIKMKVDFCRYLPDSVEK